MLGGLALLGALVGSLAAFLRIQDTGGKEPGDGDPADEPPDVATELAALRAEVAELNQRIASLQRGQPANDA